MNSFALTALPPRRRWKRVAGFTAFCLALGAIAAIVMSDVAEASSSSDDGYGTYRRPQRSTGIFANQPTRGYGAMGSFEGY